MIRKITEKAIFSFLLINILIPAFSQEIEKRTYQTNFALTAPVIDGRLNDDCWNLTEWTGNFIQSRPVENKPPSQETAFKILYDNDNIYVLIRAYDKEPEKISKIMSRRDYFEGDMVMIEFDSYFDKQSAFLFVASASGVKSDAFVTQDGNSEDDSWNPIWFLKTSVDGEGWIAEMKIPLSQLRFGKKDDQVWGMEVHRQIYRKDERSLWQFIPKGSPGRVHLFGELNGIKNIKPKHQAEIMPYMVGKTESFEKVAGDPFQTGKSSSLSAGLDGKVGITNDFTIDFTVNPDFGQVEADPSEVNLTAFESYFSERRPFFIEGKNIFQFEPNSTNVIQNMSSDNLFYSRRIGRYPHGYPSTDPNEYVKMPESTTILGAMKLSGKTKDGLSVGIMESLTSREDALIDSLGYRKKETVEPLTNYIVGRVQKDFNKGETVLGGIFTAVNRDITTQSLDYLHNAAYTAGLDFQHNWKDRTWYYAGNAEFSNVRGTQRAILMTQQSSARYFQRPDANYLSVDSTLTSLSGYGGTFKLGKSSKERIQFETSVTMRSPGLEFNDIGYMRSSDIIHHGTWVGYYIRDPFLIFNNFYFNSNYWFYWNFSGKLLSSNTNFNFNSQFKNRWRINGSFNRQSENISTTLLRGGESFIRPGNQGFNLNFSSDQSKKVSFSIGNYFGSGDRDSYTAKEYWAGLSFKPIDAFSFSLEGDYSKDNSELQYVGTAYKNNDPSYLFARLQQKTLVFTLRLNYTINPELTIEYYGQPFISAGQYSRFKKITSGSADYFNNRFHVFDDSELSYSNTDNSYNIDDNRDGANDFHLSNPDFNIKQYRSNFVVRWEYHPGSTLYLVWSQGRSGNSPTGTFRYGNDIKDLFGLTPHNVFLLKFSYWFSI